MKVLTEKAINEHFDNALTRCSLAMDKEAAIERVEAERKRFLDAFSRDGLIEVEQVGQQWNLKSYAKGVSEAQKRASNRYDRANTKAVALKLNKKTDADILAKLESVDNVQGYIKALIRADMSDNE